MIYDLVGIGVCIDLNGGVGHHGFFQDLFNLWQQSARALLSDDVVNLKIDVQWTGCVGVDATRRGVLVVCLEQGLQFGGIDCWGCWVVETDEQDPDGRGQCQKRR